MDDLQREHAECKALGEQLAAARDAADAARKHADTLEAEVKDARRAAPGSGGDAAQLQHATAAATRLADENAALRQELEAREAEIMQLQGQLTLTSSGKEDDLNWLMDA